MAVGLLLVGEELLDGRIADRNGPELGRRCRAAGVRLLEIRTVADDPARVAEAVRELGVRAQLVVVSGGLGPTLDDTTREGLAMALGVELERREPLVERLRTRYGLRGIALTEANLRQADVPRGSTTLENRTGTAEGFLCRSGSLQVVALPGVPSEFREMVERHVLPLLVGGRLRHYRRATLLGLRESELAGLVEAVELPATIRVTYCARFPVVELEWSGPDEGELDAHWERMASELSPWSIPGACATPAEAVITRGREEGWTVATAESCTGGLISSRLTDVAGSSAVFLQGWVTYSNAAKTSQLGVPEPMLDRCGAVSADVALAMARGARQRSGADMALAVSGIAGPDGGSPDKPVGTVHLAAVDGSGSVQVFAVFARQSRPAFKRLVANLGELMLLRLRDGAPDTLDRLSGVREVTVAPSDGVR
ncbi:MAG: nicotinamide-nucleotide amidohydrolase family protein [Deltaproteobacteria bacterium]|nr:MAG: nicotinamide-nucleotide amidohydrolase family protein [Deltaproteobacteria bacterium]